MQSAYVPRGAAPYFICTPAVLSHGTITLDSKLARHGLATAGSSEAVHQSAMLLVVLIQFSLAYHWRCLNYSLPQMEVVPQDLLLPKSSSAIFRPADCIIP